VALDLGLEGRLLLAAACTVIQLLLVGVIVEWVFRVSRWYLVLGVMAAMTLVAGFAAIRRTHVRYASITIRSIVMFLIASATALGTVFVVVLSYRRLFNEHHQFESMLLAQRRTT
jgi:ABC-type iron transport system FetAB permease component